MVVDTLGSHQLSTCPSSRAAFTRRHTAVNHAIRTALLGAGYTSTLEPSLLDPNPQDGNLGLRADQLVYGLEGQLETFVDVAITCPTAPTLFAGTQFRRGKAAQTRLQQKYRKYATAVRTQPGGMWLQPHFIATSLGRLSVLHSSSLPLG